MNSFETERFKVEVINSNGWHRVIDKQHHVMSPIDHTRENLELQRDAFENFPDIFDHSCEMLIQCENYPCT